MQIDTKSEEQGYEASRLPTFTEEERLEVAGSSDFLGFNVYTTDLVSSLPFDLDWPNYYVDKGGAKTVKKCLSAAADKALASHSWASVRIPMRSLIRLGDLHPL